MSLHRLIYSIILYLITPFVILRLVWKSRKNAAYRRRILERFAFFPSIKKQKIIWVHAVSVGEMIAVAPLIRKLLANYDDHLILITTTTPTGSDVIKRLFKNEFNQTIRHIYFPYDLNDVIFRFIKKTSPKLLIIMETEIWPNLYYQCNRQHIPLILINARLSKKATINYLKFANLTKETLSYTNYIAVRNKDDKKNFICIGANVNKIGIFGNIKFNLEIDNKKVEQGKKFKTQWGKNRQVFLAASTHENEDEIILSIYLKLKQEINDLILILVPRHPERFETVYQLCKRNIINQSYNIQKYSNNKNFSYKTDIIIGDTMGDLISWYESADIAFIGGSLVDVGGHNPLEAIALDVPVITAQYIYNFDDIFLMLEKAEIAWIKKTEFEILEKVRALLLTTNLLNEIKIKSKKVFAENSNTLQKLYIEIIKNYNKKN